MPTSTQSPEQLRQGILRLIQDDPWLAFDIFAVGDVPRSCSRSRTPSVPG